MINFANKSEIIIIIIIIENKIGINSLSGEKKSRKNTGLEKYSPGKICRGKLWSLAKNLVTFPRLFFPR